MKKLIAVVLLGLGAAQVAFAAENNTYTEAPFAAREFVASDTGLQGIRNYDQVDRYNP
jgi:hypothetical protein